MIKYDDVQDYCNDCANDDPSDPDEYDNDNHERGHDHDHNGAAAGYVAEQNNTFSSATLCCCSDN